MEKENLLISENRIGGEIAVLAEALAVNTSLTRLKLHR